MNAQRRDAGSRPKSAPVPGPGDRGSTRMSPEERIASLTADLHAILERAVESPAHWQVLLNTSATLWRYSGGNVALLLAQMNQRGGQQPTLVAGYREWERHGRSVLKGEHALWVIAPRTSKQRLCTLPDGTQRRQDLLDHVPDGAMDWGTTTVLTGWRGQAVFDVSQTDGEPLLIPKITTETDAGADAVAPELWDSLTAACTGQGFQIDLTGDQRGLASGYTDFTGHRIQVGDWLPPQERAAVLAHELGHVLLHGPDDDTGQLYGSSVEHRGLAEIEAESIAYTVLRAHGIDNGPRSGTYLAGWADAIIDAETTSLNHSSGYRLPTNRVDVAKSVLGRVTTATRTILNITRPASLGGKINAAPDLGDVAPTGPTQEAGAKVFKPFTEPALAGP